MELRPGAGRTVVIADATGTGDQSFEAPPRRNILPALLFASAVVHLAVIARLADRVDAVDRASADRTIALELAEPSRSSSQDATDDPATPDPTPRAAPPEPGRQTHATTAARFDAPPSSTTARPRSTAPATVPEATPGETNAPSSLDLSLPDQGGSGRRSRPPAPRAVFDPTLAERIEAARRPSRRPSGTSPPIVISRAPGRSEIEAGDRCYLRIDDATPGQRGSSWWFAPCPAERTVDWSARFRGEVQ